MNYKTIEYKELSVRVQLSVFDEKGVNEYHVLIENYDTALDTETQYRHIGQALSAVQNTLPANATLVLKRYFVSDAVNHARLLPKEEKVAISIVQQPPLNGSKVAVWAYLVCGAIMHPNGENAVIAERPAYKHLFNTQLHNSSNKEFTQTEKIFQTYSEELAKRRLSLKDHALRTWIYVQGVDTHYAGMVKARRLYFDEQGLTEQTHYLASTGIEGKYLHPETTVFMDAYAVEGIVPEQITYLKGSTHLSPTREYGVTFERATAVDYGDRRHVFVSGTASIDHKGQVVFPLDVDKQTERTLENIRVLLAEGGCEMKDVAQLIVYLRDTADYNRVSAFIAAHCPGIPAVIVWAPVCRPAWMVEMECIAVKAVENRNFAAF
ncbi:MAG: hypothetical protein LBB64_05745 [Dysgonamonadaceae bacterium]|jgi:enamine deaminase RidA (YjgF/YER057c/UK114 family)|nr:hypothetical protein [Dysgonamonadaceae bacterium]